MQVEVHHQQTFFLVALLLLPFLSHVQTTVPGFSLRGVSYPNHGLVLIDDMGESDDALYCVSDLSDCCTSSSSFRGEFYFPHGSVVPSLSEGGSFGYYRTRAADRIGLNRMASGATTGIYRCRIQTSANVEEDLYIGLYNSDEGSPQVLNVRRIDDSLVCTIGRGPATTVTWRKNCLVLPNNTNYRQTLSIDTSTTITNSTLTFGSHVTDTDGYYLCRVSNSRGDYDRDIRILGDGRDPDNVYVGVNTLSGSFIAGENKTSICQFSTATGVATSPVSYRWFGPDGRLLSTSRNLTLIHINESSAGDYSCQVTVGTGNSEKVGCGVKRFIIRTPILITWNIGFYGGSTVGNQQSFGCEFSFSINGRTVSAEEKARDTLVTYTWYKDNTVLSQSRMSKFYNVSSVQIGDAGEYKCQVTATAPYLDITHSISRNSSSRTYDVNVLTPVIRISVSEDEQSVYYKGQMLTLYCDVSVGGDPFQDVTLDIEWRRGSSVLNNDSHITLFTVGVVNTTEGLFYRSFLQYHPLGLNDDGTHTCMVTMTLVTPSNLVTLYSNGVSSDTKHLSVTAPTLTITEVSDVSTRILDTSPYNNFSLMCSARTSITLTKAFRWMRSIDSSQPVEISNSTSGITIKTTNTNQATSTSTINVTTTTAGEHTYTCQVSVESEHISKQRNTRVTVEGPLNPSNPYDITVTAIRDDRATIQWTVLSMAYDPETYTVHYGTVPSNLNLFSTPVSSGDDITRTNFGLSVTLTGLSRGTQYYYQMVVTNAAGTTSSGTTFTFQTTGNGTPGNEPTTVSPSDSETVSSSPSDGPTVGTPNNNAGLDIYAIIGGGVAALLIIGVVVIVITILVLRHQKNMARMGSNTHRNGGIQNQATDGLTDVDGPNNIQMNQNQAYRVPDPPVAINGSHDHIRNDNIMYEEDHTYEPMS